MGFADRDPQTTLTKTVCKRSCSYRTTNDSRAF